MAETSKLFDMDVLSPGKILRQMMESKGWSVEELAAIAGRSAPSIYSILAGATLTVETAVAFAAAFGNSPQEWLRWENLYRLSIAKVDTKDVERKARLYKIAPVRDMQKRGWIETTNDPSEIESALKKFFESESVEGEISFPIAPRRPTTSVPLSPAERAWCFRARQLAKTLIVAPFAPTRLDTTEKKLRQLAAYPKEGRHIPKVLSEAGIRFVVVEPIPGAKIDGAAFWIGAEPVIALSLQYDRIDNVWFTLMHEFAHIRFGDASVDTNLIDGKNGLITMLFENEAERRANERAADSLIPQPEIQSFISRVGPYYAKDRIVQFSHRMRIHPGIIVGQLQYRKEIGYRALREWLVKIRSVITSTALTDGWGQTITPATL